MMPMDGTHPPKRSLKIGSPIARIGDFSGYPAPAAERPQRRLFERKARVSSLQRGEEEQGRKMSSARGDRDLQRSLKNLRRPVQPLDDLGADEPRQHQVMLRADRT